MTTAVQVQYRRGTAAQVAAFTGAAGEMVVDTTNQRVAVQDGATQGGWPADLSVRTAVNNANYTTLATDRIIAFTALTSTQTVSLIASASYPVGTRLLVVDESGACSPSNTITLAANGSDLINGAASAVISQPNGYLEIESNAAGGWTIVGRSSTNLPAVSIGTAYDPNNVLSVAGASALFNGSSGFNVTVNKGAAGQTASFIFEDGFSGRAQIGLCGDDNFHFKVSPNGSSWIDALDINASTGAVTFANGSGTTAINFGVFPGASDTQITVSDPGIVGTSVVQAEIMVAATSDHTADEHWVEEIDVIAGNIVAGTGFTIYARCRQGSPALYGAWNVSWIRR